MRPGIYSGISNADYHRGEGVSSTALKAALKSTRHYVEYMEHGIPETPPLRFGGLLHSLRLEPETTPNDYFVVDVGSRNAVAYKEASGTHKSKVVVLQKELEQARAMIAAMDEHDALAAEMLNGATCEQSVYWMDPRTGLICKCRPDIWRDDISLVADLKTCECANERAVLSAIFRYDYDLSAAWYMSGIEAAKGNRPDGWFWIFQEKKAPYVSQAYYATDEVIANGERKVEIALDRIARFQQTQYAEGYSHHIIPVELPRWAKVEAT